MPTSQFGSIRSKAATYPEASTHSASGLAVMGSPGMMSSGMRVQITSHSLAASISCGVKPSALAWSREPSAWVKTSTATPESRRLRAHERPWLPYPTTATLCPSSADRSASDS